MNGKGKEGEEGRRNPELHNSLFHISTEILGNSRSRFQLPPKERDLHKSTVTKYGSNPLVSLASWHSALLK